MSAMASQITSLTIVYSIVYSGADQRKHQSFASLDFVRVIHRWPVNSSHKGASDAENDSIWWRHHDTFRHQVKQLLQQGDLLFAAGGVFGDFLVVICRMWPLTGGTNFDFLLFVMASRSAVNAHHENKQQERGNLKTEHLERNERFN